MQNEPPEKLQIFLLLALRQAALFPADEANTGDSSREAEKTFSTLAEQLPAAESEKFELLRADYQGKSAAEKQKWRETVERFIGTDESFVDRNVHISHIDAALRKETPAIRKIIEARLSHRTGHLQNTAGTEISGFQPNDWLAKRVRMAFSSQFAALRDVPGATDFDLLSGAQFVRLVRLAGVGEVARACVRIPAVESVAAFLRRFPPEDARAIAAQLKSLPTTSDERLEFAENLVRAALEIEPNPAAMLDLLGIRLVGILLCDAAPERLVYARQKLPVEAGTNLSEVVENECRQTAPEMRREIGSEIEKLAETIAETVG